MTGTKNEDVSFAKTICIMPDNGYSDTKLEAD